MTKSLVEEVQENSQAVAACPSCSPQSPGLADTPANQMGQGSNGLHKRGPWKGYPRSSMPLCQFCKGSGVVYLNRICECGMPAVLYTSKQKVWYCGADGCAQSAAWRAERAAIVHSPAGPWSAL